MGRLFLELLDDEYVYCCRVCKNLLATQTNFKSDAFQGSSGKAYLFENVSNIVCSQIEEKQMTTGKHVVRDIFCKLCQSRLGWTYELAIPVNQQYKEGKYILEQNFIERSPGVACKEKPKERSTSSSPEETYNSTNYGATHYAISTTRHNMPIAYPAEPYTDFSRLLNRAVAFNYTNEVTQRRHNARLRRAHLPS